jgi:hypothetical protein
MIQFFQNPLVITIIGGIIVGLVLYYGFGIDKKEPQSDLGDGGEIYIAARKITGTGTITANGGDGIKGGKGGKVTMISDDNQFEGDISTEGGKSMAK